MTVELLVNPFCMSERDVDALSKLCARHDTTLWVGDLWHLDNEDVDGLPDYISSLIREWRSGERPGSVYSSVFVNGERVPLNDWPEHMEVVEAKIVASLRGSNK